MKLDYDRINSLFTAIEKVNAHGSVYDPIKIEAGKELAEIVKGVTPEPKAKPAATVEPEPKPAPIFPDEGAPVERRI